MVVLDKDSLVGGDDMDGHCELKMDTLRDQLMHDVWLDLHSVKDQPIPGKLHVIAQWIHSSRTFYTDFIARILAKMEQEQSIRARLEAQLEKVRGNHPPVRRLIESHGILLNLDLDTVTMLGKEEESRPIPTTLLGSFTVPASRIVWSDPLSEFTQGTSKTWLMLLLCSILSCAFRFDLVNECIAVAGFACSVILSRREIAGSVRSLIIGLATALLYDTVWVLVGSGYVRE